MDQLSVHRLLLHLSSLTTTHFFKFGSSSVLHACYIDFQDILLDACYIYTFKAQLVG